MLRDFADRVAALASELTVADGFAHPGADVGPVTMEEIRARTAAHVADAASAARPSSRARRG